MHYLNLLSDIFLAFFYRFYIAFGCFISLCAVDSLGLETKEGNTSGVICSNLNSQTNDMALLSFLFNVQKIHFKLGSLNSNILHGKQTSNSSNLQCNLQNPLLQDAPEAKIMVQFWKIDLTLIDMATEII